MKFSWKQFGTAALCGFMLLAARTAPARVVDGNIIMDQRMSENLCAITFDDGPSRNTMQLLDMLDQYGIPATFFLLGKQVELHPDIVRRIAGDGHEIGNHSYSHPNLRLLSPERKADEIRRTDAILRSLGVTPLFLRPPYGAFDQYTVDVADALSLSIVLWSLDSRDWKSLPADYAKLRSTRGYVYPTGTLRGVFLFHDTHKSTVEDLPRIIAHLRAGGCQRFVTVSEYLDGLPDPEPGLLMTRRSLKGEPGQMPLAARHTVEGVEESAEPPARSWPAGSGPVPLARSSKPWQPAKHATPLPSFGQALDQHSQQDQRDRRRAPLPSAAHAASSPLS